MLPVSHILSLCFKAGCLLLIQGFIKVEIIIIIIFKSTLHRSGLRASRMLGPYFCSIHSALDKCLVSLILSIIV